jgi:soluble lytic murein transglycosylase
MTISTRIFLLVLAFAVFHPPLYAQTSDLRETFAKAHAFYSSGNHDQAKELFQKTIDAKFRLADYSLYYLASIAVKESNRDRARQLLSELRQGYPRSVWSDAARLQRAKIDLADKKLSQAVEALRRLRQDKAVKREIADEALYLQAQAQENLGNPNAAYTLYQELRGASPTSRWTAAARKDQARLREAYPDLFPFQTFQSLAEEADRLVRERQTSDAEILYRRLLNNATEPESRLRYLAKLADLYLTTRNRNEAIPLFDQIAREYPDTPEAPRALYQIGQILWNRHDNAQALEYFKTLLEKYPTSAPIDRAQYAAADIHEYFGRKEPAIELYTNVRKQFPNSQVRDDAGWRLAWLYYRAGDLPEAASAFRELATQSKNGPFATAAIYWQARVAERSGDVETAKQIFRQIVMGTDESYYQTLSARGLERLGAALEESKLDKPVAANEADPAMGPEITFHLERARELSALSLHRLAVVELDEAQRNAKPQGRVRALLMREYFLNRAYGQSLRLASQLPLSQNERDLYRYPLAFWELVQQKARERGLDPYLVLGLIRQESLFDARARSPAAAFGLMQLVPPTAARVAKQLGLPPPSSEKLFDPETNVTLGTEYLKDLLQRYSNNWFKAIAAYNAGETAVDRWEREIVTDDIEEFVERIPYVETRGYVKLVLRNHRIYKRLYETQK